jgi:hypothetical protein
MRKRWTISFFATVAFGFRVSVLAFCDIVSADIYWFNVLDNG